MRVRDVYGNPLAGIAVTFTAPSGGLGGTFGTTGSTTAVVLTNAQGEATAPAFTANHLTGSYTITASAEGVATPANFQLTNIPWRTYFPLTVKVP